MAVVAVVAGALVAVASGSKMQQGSSSRRTVSFSDIRFSCFKEVSRGTLMQLPRFRIWVFHFGGSLTRNDFLRYWGNPPKKSECVDANYVFVDPPF